MTLPAAYYAREEAIVDFRRSFDRTSDADKPDSYGIGEHDDIKVIATSTMVMRRKGCQPSWRFKFFRDGQSVTQRQAFARADGAKDD